MPYKIAVLNDIHLLPETQREIITLAGNSIIFPNDSPESETELISRTGDAEAILVSPGTRVTDSYLKACPSVKYVGLCGTSTANIDLAALGERQVSFTNVINYGDEPTAEFIFMQLIALARGMGRYQWQEMPCELMGKSIGIIGLGALGKAVAQLALAFKMEAGYFSSHRKPEWEDQGLRYFDLQTLLSTSQIIVISTPTNIKVLGKAEFALVKPNSVLVQGSMGDTFDRAAFLDWIADESNFAVFDYSAGEQNYNAYKDLPRVIFPKVVAGHTYETKQRLGQKVIENLKSYLESEN